MSVIFCQINCNKLLKNITTVMISICFITSCASLGLVNDTLTSEEIASYLPNKLACTLSLKKFRSLRLKEEDIKRDVEENYQKNGTPYIPECFSKESSKLFSISKSINRDDIRIEKDNKYSTFNLYYKNNLLDRIYYSFFNTVNENKKLQKKLLDTYFISKSEQNRLISIINRESDYWIKNGQEIYNKKYDENINRCPDTEFGKENYCGYARVTDGYSSGTSLSGYMVESLDGISRYRSTNGIIFNGQNGDYVFVRCYNSSCHEYEISQVEKQKIPEYEVKLASKLNDKKIKIEQEKIKIEQEKQQRIVNKNNEESKQIAENLYKMAKMSGEFTALREMNEWLPNGASKYWGVEGYDIISKIISETDKGYEILTKYKKQGEIKSKDVKVGDTVRYKNVSSIIDFYKISRFDYHNNPQYKKLFEQGYNEYMDKYIDTKLESLDNYLNYKRLGCYKGDIEDWVRYGGDLRDAKELAKRDENIMFGKIIEKQIGTGKYSKFERYISSGSKLLDKVFFIENKVNTKAFDYCKVGEYVEAFGLYAPAISPIFGEGISQIGNIFEVKFCKVIPKHVALRAMKKIENKIKSYFRDTDVKVLKDGKITGLRGCAI
ncbi:MAG: hypothetical protein MJ250_06320 [Alphaproteobacteria bacterium]|nr:hypothetical protein [Alphaproteobacteria bacterium]